MTKHSKISIASFTASLFLTGIFFAVLIQAYRFRFDFPARFSPEEVLVFAVSTIGYFLVFLVVLGVNIAMLSKEGQAKWLPAAGLTMQGVSLIVMAAMVLWSKSIPTEVSGITIVEYGHYNATVVDSVFTDDSLHSKYNILDDIELIVETDTIPASLGKSFGFRYTVNGFPSGRCVPVRIVNIYPSPGLRDPRIGFVRKTVSRTVCGQIGATQYTGYTSEYEWEVIPGEWTWQMWVDDRKLAEKTFIVAAR